MCKYCGKSCLGEICPDCRAEQNSILWNNDECMDLNAVFGICGLFKFLSLIAVIVSVILGITGVLTGTILWIALIITSGLFWMLTQMRKIYEKQMAIVIDRVMRNNHS